MPESRLIIAAMLDFQNLRELGKVVGEGTGERGKKTISSPPPSPHLSFSQIPTLLVAFSTLSNLFYSILLASLFTTY